MYDNVFQLRNKMDEEVYEEVFVQNIYQLPDDMSDSVMIDIGAHIGAASYKAAENGCKFILCVEPLLENFLTLAENMSMCHTDVRMLRCAAVGDTNTETFLYLSPLNECQEGNQSTVWWEESSRSAPTIQLETLITYIKNHYPSYNTVIKIDCEGSEHDILMHSDLSWVSMIVGEVHDVPANVWRDGSKHTQKDLLNHLTSVGFVITIIKEIDSELAIFKATRKE